MIDQPMFNIVASANDAYVGEGQVAMRPSKGSLVELDDGCTYEIVELNQESANSYTADVQLWDRD